MHLFRRLGKLFLLFSIIVGSCIGLQRQPDLPNKVLTALRSYLPFHQYTGKAFVSFPLQKLLRLAVSQLATAARLACIVCCYQPKKKQSLQPHNCSAGEVDESLGAGNMSRQLPITLLPSSVQASANAKSGKMNASMRSLADLTQKVLDSHAFQTAQQANSEVEKVFQWPPVTIISRQGCQHIEI